MGANLLEVKDLTVGYGNIRVLKGLSLKLKKGERVGLFGPNGHGKSTLLDSISGLIKPEGGDILFNGKQITDWTAKKIIEAGLVHVCQGNTLFPRMDVLENLYCGAYRKKEWRNRKHNVKKVYKLFPCLAERKKQTAQTLSGGERQMLAIGAGIMGGGKLLVLDEPTLGLSPLVRQELSKAIGKIAQGGVSIILVEQDFEFLSNLVDRFYMIEEGRVVFEGRPEDLSSDQIAKMYFGGAGNGKNRINHFNDKKSDGE
jgi:branched-chain amino acid transport system ATP-binding protein